MSLNTEKSNWYSPGLHPYWLDFTVLGGAINVLEEKSNH